MSTGARIAVGFGLLITGAVLWWFVRGASRAPSAPTTTTTATAGSTTTTATGPTGTERAPRAERAGFVDEQACGACHGAQAAAWRGSDHDLAMQPASAETVLGDFNGARFQDQSTDTLFERTAGGFTVTTEGPDGTRASFDAPYVFGVRPLQQLLLALPKGRLQAFSVAWDVKGARWFSLYPDERIDARDPLHWTRGAQNWNFTCAECHATDLARNYDPDTDTYATTWNRLDVGCQACHGPGARHLEWALGEATPEVGRGFDAPLAVADSAVEIEACARCHARRAPLGDGFDHRNRLLDDYLPALLTTGLYHADGQIQDEVYEYGSFLQSKMHAHGLRCSDCHEPHSLRLRQSGNVLCTGCHSPTPAARPHVDLKTLVRKNYDSAEHHHHAPGTPGSQCVDCHMPKRTYMGVDPRRDHGFRVPRPDLAAETGAPDACTSCHGEKGAAWAAERTAEWREGKEPPSHWGVALQAGRTGRAGAAQALLALAREPLPAIVRATALRELARYPSHEMLAACETARADPDGLVRLAALDGLEHLSPQELPRALAPLFTDPLRGVRVEAAGLLTNLDLAALGPLDDGTRKALEEYEAVQRELLERPEARLNLAQLERARGERAKAEAELRAALRLDPLFVPAYVNLAELARTSKGESEAEGVLRDGLAQVPDAAALHHSLGLALVRQERAQEGLQELARAAELAPEDPRFGYVLAIALHDLERPAEARAALERVVARHPGYRDARFALANYRAEAGDAAGAQRCLAELAAINPYDPGLAAPVAPGPPRR